MKRRLKLLLFGDPGVGKSSFACRLPKPFFITTDGNYEWLDIWGAKEEDHVKVFNWKEAKAEIAKQRPGYETIVVDLLEDLFKWSEEDFCIENDIKHISALGWGEGYDRQRNDFLNTLNRLINEDKHVVFIMHQTAITSKDRRGVEKTYFRPSNRIPDKVLDVIEGRMNVLRCYLDVEENEKGQLIKKRLLSLVPKENEWAIIRGVNEDTLPQDIELDPKTFCQLMHIETSAETVSEKPAEEVQKPRRKAKADVKEEPKEEVKEEVKEETPNKLEQATEELAKAEVEPHEVEEKKEQVVETQKAEVKEEVSQQTVEEVKDVSENKSQSVADLRAKILAKLQKKKENN